MQGPGSRAQRKEGTRVLGEQRVAKEEQEGLENEREVQSRLP